MSNHYQIQTEIFSGPIELLLFLVRKNELDIFDIPLKQITEDYLNFLNSALEFNVELSSDFLLMATVLLRLKVLRLLPSLAPTEELPPTKLSLEEIVNEYKKYVSVANILSDLENKRAQLFPRRSQIWEASDDSQEDVYLLISAFQQLLSKNLPRPSIEIPIPEIKLEDKLNELRTALVENKKINFQEITKHAQSLIEIIVIFIALLELIRLGEVKVFQATEFSDILILKKETQ
ncbi:MAG: segregation/condensation protein A [candidate division WOR-3 bacterium]